MSIGTSVLHSIVVLCSAGALNITRFLIQPLDLQPTGGRVSERAPFVVDSFVLVKVADKAFSSTGNNPTQTVADARCLKHIPVNDIETRLMRVCNKGGSAECALLFLNNTSHIVETQI